MIIVVCFRANHLFICSYVAGLTLTMGALGLSAYYMVNDQGIKANNMLWCRIIFHSLTVVAIAGGYAYRDYKKRNKKNLTLLEALEVHE